ncbi:unnamed protein product [Diamesa serratosioi]
MRYLTGLFYVAYYGNLYSDLNTDGCLGAWVLNKEDVGIIACDGMTCKFRFILEEFRTIPDFIEHLERAMEKISSSRSSSTTRAYEDPVVINDESLSSIAASSQTLASSSTLSVDPSKLEEIVVNQTMDIATHSGINRGEVRKSKSKVRSYLKKCKDAIYGHQITDDTCIITVNEDLPQSSNTSWYLAEIESNTIVKQINNEREKEQLKNVESAVGEMQVEEQEIECKNMIENMPLGDSQTMENIYSITSLIDKYLGHLYPQYMDHTRTVLIRQARDILVCTFHGDLTKFEEIFLVPAAEIVKKIKERFPTNESVSQSFLLKL